MRDLPAEIDKLRLTNADLAAQIASLKIDLCEAEARFDDHVAETVGREVERRMKAFFSTVGRNGKRGG